jgi:dienelactone hydrolase
MRVGLAPLDPPFAGGVPRGENRSFEPLHSLPSAHHPLPSILHYIKRRAAVPILLLLAVFLTSWASLARAADLAQPFPHVVSVTQTYNNAPFDYRIESRSERPAFSVLRLAYPSPVVTPVEQNNTIPAEYYLPKGIRPLDPRRPAVICMHILEGDFVLVRMTCSMLASRGIPAIMFKLPYYGERGFPNGPEALASDPRLFVGALSQAFDDVRRTIDLVASRPEVDPQRIGITGISLGGIVAAAAAERDTRLWRVMPILAGGDLRQIIHHALETRDLSRLIRQLPPEERVQVEQAIDAADPLRHAERLRDRARHGRVLMVNAAEDEVIPPACTERLASALGIADRVVWLQGLGHYTALAKLPQILETMADFFGQDLPPGLEVRPPAPAARTPLELVASLVQQAATLLLSMSLRRPPSLGRPARPRDRRGRPEAHPRHRRPIPARRRSPRGGSGRPRAGPLSLDGLRPEGAVSWTRRPDTGRTSPTWRRGRSRRRGGRSAGLRRAFSPHAASDALRRG